MTYAEIVHSVVYLSNTHTWHICQAAPERARHTSVPSGNRMTLVGGEKSR